MDYDALAKQSGATGVDFDALAQESGGRNIESLIAGRTKGEEAKASGQKYRELFGGGARKKGAGLPSSVQGLLTALQGPNLGFGDEMAGAGAAFAGVTSGDFNVADNYVQGRDMARGAQADFEQQRPVLAGTTKFAASAPLMGVGAGPARVAGAVPMSMTRSAIAAAKPAAALGGIGGVGASESNTVGGVLTDGLLSAATSAVLAGGSDVGIRAMGAAGRPAIAALSRSSADDYARQKVAEGLIRDTRPLVLRDAAGGVLREVDSDPIAKVGAKLAQLGDDARLIDAGDVNARRLLDLQASAPGRTAPAVERLIRQRQTARAGNLVSGAQQALGVSGNYVDDIAAFTAQREMAAAPLYAKAYAEAPPIVIPKDILLRDSVTNAYKTAQKLAAEKGVTLPPMNPGAVQPIPPLSLQQADFLKRAMDDVLFAAKMPTSNVGKNQYGLMMDTRTALVKAIDDQAGPTYAKARAAFAGPTRAREAAELGRNLLKEDATEIPAMIRDLGESEREALKIGVVQAVRDKAGTQSGQTQLLKMWANPGLRDRLKLVFGNDFRSFQRAVLAEERKKVIEGAAGRGSQTAARQFGAEDLDTSAVEEVGQVVSSAARGNPLGALWASSMNRLGRLQTPEPVRDEIGRILLSSGPEARNMLAELAGYVPRINAARAARADATGRLVGLGVPSLLVQP